MTGRGGHGDGRDVGALNRIVGRVCLWPCRRDTRAARRRARVRVAELGDGRRVVRDEHDGYAVVDSLWRCAIALLREEDVADGQRLVDEQHVGVDARGHRKRQPHEHAARVRLDRLIEEARRCRRTPRSCRSAASVCWRVRPRIEALTIDVLAAGVFRIEAAAEFEQRRDAAADLARAPSVGASVPARIWSSVLLPEPLRPMTPSRSPARQLERDVCERPEVAAVAAAERRREHLLQPILRRRRRAGRPSRRPRRRRRRRRSRSRRTSGMRRLGGRPASEHIGERPLGDREPGVARSTARARR